MSGGLSLPNPLRARPTAPVPPEWYVSSMMRSNNRLSAVRTFSYVSLSSFFAFHLFSSVFCSISVIAMAGILNYSPTLRGSIHGVREYRMNAAGSIMYPTKPSLGWCGWVIFLKHLLMACKRCHSPWNIGRPAIGYMVARIAVIASVVYFAIVVGGFFGMIGATIFWEHVSCLYY